MKKFFNSLTSSDLAFGAMTIAAAVLLVWSLNLSHRRKTTEIQRDTLLARLLETHEKLRRANLLLDSLHAVKMFEDDAWWRMIDALIHVESGGHPDAVGDDGQAVGVLQIHPCVIDDLRVAGYDFTLDDRLDPDRSIAIFNAYQRIYNPARDIDRAIHLHNPHAGADYRDRVIKAMEEAK